MIEVSQLCKRFGETCAVDGVSFRVGEGEAFGLLGPNGAGKTTTILMLVGALRPDAGQVALGGRPDPTRPEVRRIIGVAPQGLAIYPELSGQENLAFFGRVYGLSGAKLAARVDWALEFAGLSERRKDRAGSYSGGMQRRLNLACALVHEPRVLVCDEPTVGVDPQSRNHIFESLEQLRSEGLTLLYTTHYMEEAQRLCDRVAIMDHGRVLALDTVPALIERHGGTSLVEAELGELPPPDLDLPGELNERSLRVSTERPFEVVAQLGRSGVAIERLRVDRPDLERVFLQLTGRRLRD
ncbi:MAG: ABC transporter ATP-binding protein [Planctomycetota bacterium]|nr:MAG: ABC transporter ATP-binding protein [Planctomycetota bacterium]